MPLNVDVLRDGNSRDDLVWSGPESQLTLNCLLTAAILDFKPEWINDSSDLIAENGFVDFSFEYVYGLKIPLMEKGKQTLKKDYSFRVWKDPDKPMITFKKGDVLTAYRSHRN